ncbi:hypothetical protein E7T06_13285 [Deinococcus sp. Arct2-2]|uniref:hypothetical protein n=1 Tax=Deinococcus sp. Arct2-2 TaxID=2568653 RepID=UPI0010A3AF9F|nr:hypothetical protein [Deinococcus sp. Arct2-2]THF69139.1 hypothetical protein E7T06_13285 [Deinococcus sp. Arct2-2]
MEPPSSGSESTPGELRLWAGFLLWQSSFKFYPVTSPSPEDFFRRPTLRPGWPDGLTRSSGQHVPCGTPGRGMERAHS